MWSSRQALLAIAQGELHLHRVARVELHAAYRVFLHRDHDVQHAVVEYGTEYHFPGRVRGVEGAQRIRTDGHAADHGGRGKGGRLRVSAGQRGQGEVGENAGVADRISDGVVERDAPVGLVGSVVAG